MLKTNFKRILSCIISIVLIAAVALMSYGCIDKKAKTDEATTSVTNQYVSATELGKGENYFSLTVTDGDGNEIPFSIRTDKKTVGEALLELNLIEGEDGQYGLYIKKVNGIEADYEKNGTYWAFYVDGQYASSGVDTTDIVNGSAYQLKVEK